MAARNHLSYVAAVVLIIQLCSAQTFQRLGACPKLGCIFPPDQVDFLAGQYFDIRLEVHAPVNGTEATGNPNPDENFKFTIAREGESAQDAAPYLDVPEPELERWNFTWYEDLFAQDAETPSLVRVASKAYRRVALRDPGEYTATLTYANGTTTVATWLVRDLSTVRKAKNVVLFIGDGMTTNMITAARLIAHKSINGRYQSNMQMDKFPVLGHQMTHSLDSFITDSANSATAIYSGHKTTVNALGTYRDSSEDPTDDPKIESIAELFQRLNHGGIGIVSTAAISDATPAALTAHTSDRSQYGEVVDSFLNGITNYTWTNWTGPDVLFGGGAEQFFPGEDSYRGEDYYAAFADRGYNVVLNNSALSETSTDTKTLGIFSVSTMSTWLDRNVYTDGLVDQENSPDGQGGDATDQPGLKEMTLKAVDILSSLNPENGWFLMSEGASIDKQMHTLDYDRALGELLEFDDTIKATMAKLEAMGQLNDTLIVVTADHGHGFDVMGSVDTKYLNAQSTDREKRGAVGYYKESGLSQYTVPDPTRNNTSLKYSDGVHFPSNWDPRYTLFQGVSANPDRRENYQVHQDEPRLPATNLSGLPEEDFYANPEDAASGFLINGTLPVSVDQGVHSLTDVPVFAQGPCQELFGGVYGNVDIFFNLADCLGLSRPSSATAE
ncbi:MAG: hypothetical protein M1837_006829 [Sclerophora amabilis]|nr:MAG: hypothetical protein M1837_006829 [Sclerophora amabilis]